MFFSKRTGNSNIRFLSPMHTFLALLLLGSLTLAATDPTKKESSYHRFAIGYDRGISLRYFTSPSLAFGLVATASGYSPLFEYSNQTYERNENNDFYRSTTHSNEKNASLYFDAIYRIKQKDMFMFSLFTSAGGHYSTFNESSEYSSRYSPGSSSGLIQGPITSSQNNVRKIQDLGLTGRFGIMPGFIWKFVTVELRLGLEGLLSWRTSPDDGASEKTEGSSRTIKLLYPSNLVESFVIHVEL